ncbi:MAG: ABC transporter ATP-binding protein [Rhabdochlamydiaceae bacterium]
MTKISYSNKLQTKIRREKIGFVFQSFNLLPYLNARENVEPAMEGTKKSKSERSERVCELLCLVGLSGREEHQPAQLSAGQRQRVAIARALANNPSVILTDELTGNLDGKTKFDVLKLLVNLNLKYGTTIITVTHDNQVEGETERILRLHHGRIQKQKEGNLARRKLDHKWSVNDLSTVTEAGVNEFEGHGDEDVEGESALLHDSNGLMSFDSA